MDDGQGYTFNSQSFVHLRLENICEYLPQAPNPIPVPATSTANTLNPTRKAVPFPISVTVL
jgi:hypothetical protein